MINFPTRILDSHSPALFSEICNCSSLVYPPLENYANFVVSVSFVYPSDSKKDVSFNRTTFDYSRADWESLCDHL